MDSTFITIHGMPSPGDLAHLYGSNGKKDLTADGNIVFCSNSVVDVLGYSTEDVAGRSCWEYFHPDELIAARRQHARAIEQDKAAALSYCQLRAKDGRWVGCEVVFTVVFDVLIGCTSIYRRSVSAQNRASFAPAIRKLFSSSPRDPRYHMLSHLSPRLRNNYVDDDKYMHEPRAALFLNRYTRTLTIMHATNGLQDILGLTGDEMKLKSFYYCIQSGCLKDAISCLETAKANDSIAYIRFWWRDPRRELDSSSTNDFFKHFEGLSTQLVSGVGERAAPVERWASSSRLATIRSEALSPTLTSPTEQSSRGSPRDDASTRSSVYSPDSSCSSAAEVSAERQPDAAEEAIELEAVVSCTSDGLVVCMRQAHPLHPESAELLATSDVNRTSHGIFAVPWSSSSAPEYKSATPLPPGNATAPATGEQAHQRLMDSIRDIAVFAWALTGINGSLVDISQGTPRGEALPSAGLPVWQPGPLSQESSELGSASDPGSGTARAADANDLQGSASPRLSRK